MALSTHIVPSSLSFPSSSDSLFPTSYDAFISFCGVDTRNGFVDHLYADFERKGLIVFKDDEKLEQGNSIRGELLKAIKHSQYAVVVISKNFAFSKWCLIELDKILECEAEERLKILPVFYHIDPSEVRNQKDIFAEAFAKHKEDPDVSDKQRIAWSTALRKVGNVAGWHVQPIISAEATVVKKIIGIILCGVQSNSSKSFKGLVGIGSRVKKLEKELCLGMDDVRLIGIYGMSGIGKTTLAEALFKKVRYEFEASCFICCGDNKRIWEIYQQIVHEILGESNLRIWDPIHGMELLETRLRNKKIFIVLDDMDCNQLEQLIGRTNWFGQGSRIVVNGKDRQLLKPYVNKTYEFEPLGDEDALDLFCQKAFKNSCPKPSYRELVKNIMRQVNGHPLAIAVIGSSLYDKQEEVWIGVRDILEVDSNDKILTKLEISYCMLGDSLKKYFLDIACFGGWFVDILKLFNPNTSLHIGALEDKSLINTSRFREVVMHDLLRKLGQREAIKMSPLGLGNRVRLWVAHDIIQVLRNNFGIEAIETIVMGNSLWNHCSKDQPRMDVKYESFSKMTRLTVLILRFDEFFYLKWIGNPSKLMLSNELRVIQWMGFPLKSLPGSFQSDVLVKLCLRCSKIEVLWIGKKSFGQLKNIDLSYSKYLMETLDLNGVPNLEELWLDGCERLRKFHSSITNLGKLVRLGLGGCRQLRDDVTSLLPLDSHNGGIRMLLLSSLKSLSSLRQLDLSSCSNLLWRPIDFDWFFKTNPSYSRELIGPHTCGWLTALTSITRLVLRDCNLLNGDIPNDINCLSLLEDLDLSMNGFTRIPKGITQLSNLKYLYMNRCRFLRSLSTSPPLCLSSLSYPLSNLKIPTTHKCHLLQSSFVPLFSNLSSLSQSCRTVCFSNCNLLDTDIPNHLGYLSWVVSLELFGNKFTTLPLSFFLLSNLKRLDLGDCRKLRTLPKFPLSLRALDVVNCPLLEMNYYKMDVRKLPLCNSVWFSAATNTIYDGTPYKILQLNPQHLLDKYRQYCFAGGDMFAWGPLLGFEIPRCFNHISINLFQKIQCYVNVDSKYEKMGLALFVAYQLHGQENSNCSISQARLFKKNGRDLDNCQYPKTAIETSNLKVEVNECGVCMIHEHNVSEFLDVLNSITPHGLELKNLKDFDFEVCAGVLSEDEFDDEIEADNEIDSDDETI